MELSHLERYLSVMLKKLKSNGVQRQHVLLTDLQVKTEMLQIIGNLAPTQRPSLFDFQQSTNGSTTNVSKSVAVAEGQVGLDYEWDERDQEGDSDDEVKYSCLSEPLDRRLMRPPHFMKMHSVQNLTTFLWSKAYTCGSFHRSYLQISSSVFSNWNYFAIRKI